MEVYRQQSDYTGLQTSPTYGDPQYFPQVPVQLQPQVYGEPKSTRKICGLKRSTFWLSLAIVLVLVAVIIGATVGGVVGSRRTGAAGLEPSFFSSYS